MKTYVVTSPNFSGSLVFKYDLNGILRGFENSAELSELQLSFLCRSFPFTVTVLLSIEAKSKSMQVREVAQDLSFESFWDTYGYKVGNKEKCRKLWNALTDSVRIRIMQSLPAYKYYLKISGIAQVYPERFISQKRYENDYTALARKK